MLNRGPVVLWWSHHNRTIHTSTIRDALSIRFPLCPGVFIVQRLDYDVDPVLSVSSLVVGALSINAVLHNTVIPVMAPTDRAEPRGQGSPIFAQPH